MSTEMQMLVWSIVLGLAQLAIAASFNTGQRGLAWGVGARDAQVLLAGGDDGEIAVRSQRQDRCRQGGDQPLQFQLIHGSVPGVAPLMRRSIARRP